MSFQLANVLLPLLCLLCPCMGANQNSMAVPVVNQTPPYIHAVGGSEFTIRCALNISNQKKWFGEWHKTRNNVTEKLPNSNGTNRITLADTVNMTVSLTVKKADVSDSGTYVCVIGTSTLNELFPGNGTQVTIHEMTDLTVTQTPGSVCAVEGSELTMHCTFQNITSLSTMYVRWYQAEGPQKELVNGSDVLTALRLESGLASLTLKNVKSSDTGRYVCEVGSTARNLSGTGAGTHVTIQTLALLVNQTPTTVNAEEGKQLTITCRFRAPESPCSALNLRWYKHGTDDGEKEMKNETGSVTTALDVSAGQASLVWTKATMNDSGRYRCDFGKYGRGAEITVTIRAVDLLVSQSPAELTRAEGEKLTIECRFKVVEESMYSVTWYKRGSDGHETELKNGTGNIATALNSSMGLASLTLVKISRNDSGLYRCDFGKSGGGNGTRVTIDARDPGVTGSYIVPGAVAGAALFLLVLGICVWRWRQRSKKPPQSRPEAEMNQTKRSLPADEVTYADLNFRKRDAKVEEEIVYTEVKIRPKQTDGNVTYAKINTHHR
ncbi:polymeric immunoglobulin receptor-like isoform X2 [Pelodiscus sinensis]|uniref:polymeric immunoglobulin receptor-like isoform X2 n=1 Tax=Pelodiscus sinensis TaxID=13735 RepID=UPI003F6C9783